MREAIITLLEIVAGPIVLLIVLPVIPTIWIFVMYPFYAYRLNHATKIHWPFWARVASFYVISVLCCLPVVSTIKDTVEYPAKLYPLLKSRGFQALIAYTILTTLFHKHLERISNHPKVQQLKKQALSIILTLFSKITRA
ncbi:MAG: hypothetical protein KBC26_02280 [Candidatus Pacebacteria bacterium]|nr:hypothetical protein [Candidatus Paceibacterota bacterium]